MFELWQRELAEFEEAYFMTSGPVAGGRESRRIVGDYELTEEDVREGRRHEEVVVLGAWRLDKYPADSAGYHEISWLPFYEIPYRTLLPKDFDNLLVAGRCHSETLAVLASSRVTATAMAMPAPPSRICPSMPIFRATAICQPWWPRMAGRQPRWLAA